MPGRPIGPWSRRTGAPEASATERDRSLPVHGGYTRSRQVGECNGHERSRAVARSRRSSRQNSHDLVALQKAGRSSSLPPPPTGPLLVAVREGGRLADSSDLLNGAAHGVLLADDGAPDPKKVRPRFPNCLPAGRTTPSGSAATSARAPCPARPTPTSSCGGSSSPGRARYGAPGTGWIIESGMTKS
jgi:hypothetical protein